MDSGVSKNFSNIKQALGVTVGRFPWRCAFGSRITRLRHLNNTNNLQQLARVDVQDCLQKWVAGAQVTGVTVAPRDNGNRNILDLTIDVTFQGKTQSVSVPL